MPYTYDPTRTSSPASCAARFRTRRCWKPQHTLAFHDIRPHAPVHVLVIPKGAYVTFDHFAAEASAEELVDFHRTAASVCAMLGVSPGEGGAGYRAIANAGRGQQSGSAALPPAHPGRAEHGAAAALSA